MVYTPKARLFAAAERQKLDRPPCICPGGMMNMIFEEIMQHSGIFWPDAHSNAREMAALTQAVYAYGGFENYGVPFCMTVEAEAMGAQVNMGTQQVEPHIDKIFLETISEWPKLTPIDLNTGRIKVVLEAIEILKKQNTNNVPIIGNLTGPISIAGSLMDMTALLKSFRKDPQIVDNLLNFITDNLIKFGRAQIKAGADAICIAEPSGTGEILGSAYFRKFTVPYLNKITQALNASITIIHICGKLHGVYDLLPQLICDVFSFDAIVPVKEIRQVLQNKALMGNISTHALFVMPAEKVESLVKNCLKNSIDILAPACGLSTVTPLMNIQRMVNTVKKSE